MYIYIYIYIYKYIYIHIYVYIYTSLVDAGITSRSLVIQIALLVGSDDDDVYLRVQHGKGFHNLVYNTLTQPKGISTGYNKAFMPPALFQTS
jgi:hypothetical protein